MHGNKQRVDLDKCYCQTLLDYIGERAHLDNDVADFNERGTLPGFADAHQLASGAALDDGQHLQCGTINTSEQGVHDKLTCKPSPVSLTPIPRGKRLLGQVAMCSAPATTRGCWRVSASTCPACKYNEIVYLGALTLLLLLLLLQLTFAIFLTRTTRY